MKPVVIAVVGGKKSGKTMTIEILIKKLKERGHKIAAIKHIPEPDFTIDQKGKDTWKFAQAGAYRIVGVSAHEIVTIEKTEFKQESLQSVLNKVEDSEVVFLEGFKDLIAKDRNVLKIVVLNSEAQATRYSRMFEPILAFTGPYNLKTLGKDPPYIDILTDPDFLVNLLEKLVRKNV